jgi:hypothetical protein
MNKPKRHHYLPDFYLNRFTDDNGLFWVYDRNKSEIRPQTPINTCVQSGYYSYDDKDGNRHTEVEELLNTVETSAEPIIEKIDQGKALGDKDKADLAPFIAFQQSRTPYFRDQLLKLEEGVMQRFMKMQLGDETAVAASMAGYEKKTGKKLNISPEKMAEMVNEGKLRVNVPESRSLLSMVYAAQASMPVISKLRWFVLIAPVEKTGFVTSDNPFHLSIPPDIPKNSPYGIGLITPGVGKIIPLSRNSCLLIDDKPGGCDYLPVDKEYVRELNVQIGGSADRFLIARDRPQLERILKTVEKFPRFNLGEFKMG